MTPLVSVDPVDVIQTVMDCIPNTLEGVMTKRRVVHELREYFIALEQRAGTVVRDEVSVAPSASAALKPLSSNSCDPPVVTPGTQEGDVNARR